MKQNMLRLFSTIAIVLFFAAGVDAKTRKGEKLLAEGKVAEEHGDWDKALDLFQQAVDESPSDAAYMIAMRRARFQAGQKHVDLGQKLRSEGKVAESLTEFQKAFVADPSSAIAIQEIKRTQQMLKDALVTKTNDIGLTPGEKYRKQEDEKLSALQGPPELKPVVRTIPQLKMNNQTPRILFDTVGKMAGINVVWDAQYTPPSRNYTVEMNNQSVDSAFDYLAQLTRVFWKPINSNTIFITEDNVTKRRDFEDQVVKVIYLTNATSVQEFQEISTAIRTVLSLRQVFTYNAQKALIVRGSLDSVLLAEKLARDLDRPKSEVVVDVMVMEANTSRTRDLAASITSAGVSGLSQALSFTPRGVTSGSGTTATQGSTINLPRFGRLASSDFSTTLPGAILQAMLSDSGTRVMNKPQVRASDGQKVTLTIGDRIPYATGSFQPGIGAVGAGVSPLVSTQFQFVDTGVTLDITPQVHSADEVTLHVEVNISAVSQYKDLGGLSQPVISQRKSTAELRLREGEVQFLGGLSQQTDAQSNSGIPGLINMPVLGKLLFGKDHQEKSRGELLIALVPHIVRTPDYQPDNLRAIFSGQEQVIKVNSVTKDDGQPDGPAASASAPVISTPVMAVPTAPAAPTGAPTAPLPAPPPTNTQLPPGGTAQLLPSLGLIPTSPAIAGTPIIPAGPSAVGFMPGSMQIPVNTPFPLAVNLNGASDAFSVNLKVKYDPALLQLNDVVPGDLLSRDGGRVTTVKDIRNETGEATLTVTRILGSPGLSGPGSVATLNFVSRGAGSTTVTVTELGLKNSQQQPIPATLGGVPVTIQP